jgi:hypothetical protein
MFSFTPTFGERAAGERAAFDRGTVGDRVAGDRESGDRREIEGIITAQLLQLSA